MIQKDDWRLMNQEVYLKGKKLFHINYNQKERHDHCEFCMEKFISKKQIGYCTEDYYYWICENCFKDFQKMFNWEIINE